MFSLPTVFQAAWGIHESLPPPLTWFLTWLPVFSTPLLLKAWVKIQSLSSLLLSPLPLFPSPSPPCPLFSSPLSPFSLLSSPSFLSPSP